MHPTIIAPSATPSSATYTSLRGAWTKTPGRLAEALPASTLERPERGRDMVALLNLDAVEDPADQLAHGLVRIDGEDADLAKVLWPGLGPVEVELVAGDQAIIRADRQLY